MGRGPKPFFCLFLLSAGRAVSEGSGSGNGGKNHDQAAYPRYGAGWRAAVVGPVKAARTRGTARAVTAAAVTAAPATPASTTATAATSPGKGGGRQNSQQKQEGE